MSVEAPERIWAASVTDSYGEWQTVKDGLPRPVEYVRADKLEELAAENARVRHENLVAVAAMVRSSERADAAEAALAEKDKEIAVLRELIRWAHDTLYEINPSDYDHDEVCRLNDASVEVILGLAPTLGETHGYTKEWWAARNAGGNDA